MRPKCAIISLALAAVGGTSARAGDYLSPAGKSPAQAQAVFEPARENHWRVSAGYLYRNLGEVEIRGGSRSAGFAMPRFFGGDRRSVPGIGPLDTLGNRTYADGFVNIDVSGSTDGLTWFWGYDNNAQVVGDTVEFHHPGGRDREVSSYRRVAAPGTFGEQIAEGGPYVQLDYMMGTKSALSWGPQLGFSFIDFDTARSRSDFAAGQSFVDYDVTYRDRFDLGGIIAPLAPFSGTFDGPGPLIPNIPSERASSRSMADAGSIDFRNRVRESLDVDLYTLSPGLSAELSHGSLYLNVAAGLAVNVVNWEALNNETLTASRDGGTARVAREWRDRNTGTDVLFGAYLQGTVGARLTESVGVSAFARYDWNESLRGTVGPSRFDVDLSGVSAGAMVTFQW